MVARSEPCICRRGRGRDERDGRHRRKHEVHRVPHLQLTQVAHLESASLVWFGCDHRNR